ncbi:hypothetical protein RJ640_012290 [Escallonia rubra]|uniref:Retrotransposon gag domain-containing protein n=1 Tax=Escallonia rubra TaxID=112253 RepID=A0AA88U285_9ASTE|nr:hypothetical protein RJ640_012290 [Escallonia rubra]
MPRSVKNNQLVEVEHQEVQEVLGTRLATYDVRMASIEATMGDMQRGFSDLKFELSKFMAQTNARVEAQSKSTSDRGESSHKNNRSEYNHQQNTPPPFIGNLPPPRLPKLSFPRFSGDDPRGWVRKAEQYFDLCPVHEDYKVPYASVHFDAQAEHWYAAYIKPIENVDWDFFVRDLYARFSVLTGVSVLGEFNKLHQMGTVDDYFNRFEALRAQVVQEFDYLDESYFCMSFIGGLRPEIQSRVEQFEVGSLTKAIYIARREEVAIQNLLRSHKVPEIFLFLIINPPSVPVGSSIVDKHDVSMNPAFINSQMAQTPNLLGPPITHLATTNPTTQSAGAAVPQRTRGMLSICLPPVGYTENRSPTYLGTGNPSLDFFFHVVLPDAVPTIYPTARNCVAPRSLDNTQARLQPGGCTWNREEAKRRIIRWIEKRLDRLDWRKRPPRRKRRWLGRYSWDAHYHFLHDIVSDFFAELLKADLEFYNAGELYKTNLTSKWCTSIDSSYDKATRMCESVTKKMFRREDFDEYKDIEDVHYVYKVKERLHKELLVPLQKVLDRVVRSSLQARSLVRIDVKEAEKAMKLYKRLFYEHDSKRFKEYLKKVKSGR